MQDKHSILVAYDDVTVQHAGGVFYISVGDQQMINVSEEQMDRLMRALDGIAAAEEA